MAKKKAHEAPSSDAAKKAGELLDKLMKQFGPKFDSLTYYQEKLDGIPAGKTILAQDRETQVVLVSMALDRLEGLEKKITAFGSRSRYTPAWSAVWSPRWVLLVLLRGLLRRSLPLGEATLIRLFQWPIRASNGIGNYSYPLSGMTTAAEHFAESNEISGPLLTTLKSFIAQLRKESDDKDCRKIADRLQALLVGGPTIQLEKGEAWSDVALADLRKKKTGASKSWNALLIHCQTGGKGKFTERWAAEARRLVDAVGFDALKEHLLRWFPLVDKPRTQPHVEQDYYGPGYSTDLIIPEHVELLRGLVWCCASRKTRNWPAPWRGWRSAPIARFPAKGRV